MHMSSVPERGKLFCSLWRYSPCNLHFTTARSEDVYATLGEERALLEQPEALDGQRSTNKTIYSSFETSMLDATSASNGLLEEGTLPSDRDGQQKAPRKCGAGGLLSTPTPIVVLFLGCVVQVTSIVFEIIAVSIRQHNESGTMHRTAYLF